MPELQLRRLARDEIELIWTIDRREIVEGIYVLERGALVLKPAYFDIPGWEPGAAEHSLPRLTLMFDRGGAFWGIFDGDQLVAELVVDTLRLGAQAELVQLAMLHVGRDYRGQGLGLRLFALARSIAHDSGARGLYISATPSEHTVDFYLRRGAVVTPTPDPALLALEPDDIHLECAL